MNRGFPIDMGWYQSASLERGLLSALFIWRQGVLAELEAVEKLREEALAAVRHGAAGLENLQTRCEEREARLERLHAELASVERRRADVVTDVEHLELRKAAIASHLDDSELRKAEAAADIERLEQREAALAAEIADHERRASETAATADGLAGRVAALESQETALRRSICELQSAERDSQAAVAASEQNLAETEALLASQQARLSDLNDMVTHPPELRSNLRRPCTAVYQFLPPQCPLAGLLITCEARTPLISEHLWIDCQVGEVQKKKIAAEAGVAAAQDELCQLQQHWQEMQRGIADAESERLSALQNVTLSAIARSHQTQNRSNQSITAGMC